MHIKQFIWFSCYLLLGTLPMNEAQKNLLASKRFCGFQHSDDFNRMVNTTSITEFPWLARLQYLDTSTHVEVFTCLGTVINDRYVLTSAECCTLDRLKMIRVRLGEFNFFRSKDCVTETQLEECSDPVRNYMVEKVIVHPNYKKGNKLENNIALVRVDTRIKYTDYIRAICLPSPDKDDLKLGDILTTSGWHNLVDKGDVKTSVVSQIISLEECSSWYTKTGLTPNENNFCTAKVNGSIDITCTGDYGAPLALARRRKQWYQEGIIIHNIRRCETDHPTVLTKVSSYFDWIVNNIEA